MKRSLSIIAIFLSLSGWLSGGEYADAFLELGVSARALAMANAIGTLDFSETAFISNPAGISYVQKPRIGLMYTSQFGLANHNYIGFATPFNPHYTIAVSWIRYGVDDIPIHPDIIGSVTDKEERRDSVISLSTSILETFSDAENAVFLSLARFNSTVVDLGWRYSKFNLEFPIGINLKFIHKKLYDLEGYGLGVDVGGRARMSGEELLDISHLGMLSVGLALKDLTGTTIYWNTLHQDRISMNPVLSFALEQPVKRLNILVNLGAEKEYRYRDKTNWGVEIIYANRLALRAGLKNSGIRAGFGLNFKVMKKLINMDYSFYNHDLGASHRVGMGIGI
ncbi:MAG: hypothetical protein V1681_01675 [Candidatus Neomarinimicrobiota bacterium]